MFFHGVVPVVTIVYRVYELLNRLKIKVKSARSRLKKQFTHRRLVKTLKAVVYHQSNLVNFYKSAYGVMIIYLVLRDNCKR